MTGTTRNIFVRQRRDKALVEVSFFPCNVRMHHPCASVIRSHDCAVDLQVKTQHVSHADRFRSTDRNRATNWRSIVNLPDGDCS